MRYNQLIPIIEKNKPKTIVEVGTWNGERAIMMATEALKHQEKVRYFGYDLFEDATDETDARELNVKKHFTADYVEAKLIAFEKQNPGFCYTLIKGDTRETLESLPKWYEWADVNFETALVFIDGGHSIETIQNDYDALKHAKVVVIDDFYSDGPDVSKFGCNILVDKVKDHVVLPQADPVKGGGKVRMVIFPRSAWPGRVSLVIKTQNCASEDEIQANIRYSAPKFDRWVQECKVHHKTAVLLSAGPTLKDHLPAIQQHSDAGDIVFCVKHSHDFLIGEGIVPFGCVLLDPRSHVQDFIENPHPDVLYFVASMCHPTTLDRLIEKKANVIGYNAHVGAGEDKALKGMGKHILIGGGSTSAVRGISVLYTMGFRRFRLYGFDSCYYEKPDFTVKTKTGAQKYVEVEVSGRKFWSDLELMAQAQDFEKLMKTGKDLDLEVFGEGMIPHIWSKTYRSLSDFGDVVNG